MKPKVRRTIPGFRWFIAALLFVETLLAYLDLQELSVLAPVLRHEIGMTDSQYALVAQAFLAAYTITFCLGGFVIDRLGVRWGLTLSLVWWSTANALHALADTPAELAVWRFLLGLGYPGAFLAAARAVSEWYPAKERAFVYGVYVSGATFGAIVAYPMVTWMTIHWSWRGPFLITGIAGLLLAVVWGVVYRRPEVHPWVSESEREYVKQGRPAEAPGGDCRWRQVLRTRPFWAVAIGRFIADNTWMFYVIWLAKFLTEDRGLSMEQVGRLGWIPYMFADVGSLAGGWASGRLIARGMPHRQARIALLTLTALVRAFTFVLALSFPTPVLIGLIGIFMMSTTAWQVNLNVMIVDNYPSRIVAATAGVTTSFGTLSSVFFTSLVAWIVERHSYGPVFALISALTIAGYGAVLLILRGAGKPVAAGQPA
ncbi:MAG: MFS transporter [Acidobacteria bacterium]|nr:MFS transporter [Acidobacteriota bacterium]